MRRRWSPLIVVLCLCAAPALGATFELEVSQWGSDLGMDARIDSGAVAGTEFNLRDDIGVDGEEAVPGVQASFNVGRSGRHHFLVSYARASYEGSNVLDRAITIDDTTYSISENVALDMDFAISRLYYGYSFIDGKRVQVGLQTGVLAVFSDGVFSAGVSGDERFEGVAPLPVIGASVQFEPTPRHRLSGFISGLSVEIGDVDGTALEYQAQYSFFPLTWLGLGAGVRGFALEAEVADEGLVDLENEGAFFNATFRW